MIQKGSNMPEENFRLFEKEELDDMTVKELKELAKDIELSGYSSMDKDALVNALLDAGVGFIDDPEDESQEQEKEASEQANGQGKATDSTGEVHTRINPKTDLRANAHQRG